MSDPKIQMTVTETGALIHYPKPGLFGKKPPNFKRLPEPHRALAYALAEAKELANDDDSHLSISADQIFISHHLISQLGAESATQLGLPPLVELSFHMDTRSTVGSADFQLVYHWHRGGRRLEGLRRTGAILYSDRGKRRLPLAILEAICVAENFDANTDITGHWTALSRFQHSLLGRSERGSSDLSKIKMTKFLSGLKIQVAEAFAILPDRLEDGSIDFDPIPFPKNNPEGMDSEQLSSQDGLLTGAELSLFQDAVRRRGAQPAYRTGDGQFLIIDRAAMPALQVIARKRRASAAERRDFVKNPRVFFAEAYEEWMRDQGILDHLDPNEADEHITATAEPIFEEIVEYSDRIIGKGSWSPLDLPMPPRPTTTWLPEEFQSEMGRWLEQIPAIELPDILEKLNEAIETKQPSITWRGLTLEALPSTRDLVKACFDDFSNTKKAGINAVKQGDIVVLQSKENFYDVNFHLDFARRATVNDVVSPASLQTKLKAHQQDCLTWAAKAWCNGRPGILNADEQGLGKTLETLAILAWLRERAEEGPVEKRRPMLIVVPKTLLGTWTNEIFLHFGQDGLGNLIELHGGRLKAIKQLNGPGREIKDGLPRLDLGSLEEAIGEGRGHNQLILTNYDTLTNYQHSLCAIPFAVVVFDEIHELKNPATLKASAGRSVNADFRIGLTGTPLVNRTEDFWALIDQLAPGSQGSLKEFSKAYGGIPDEEKMRHLHEKLFTEKDGLPSFALRRLKSDLPPGEILPPKTRILHPRPMSPTQSECYRQAQQFLGSGKKGAALKALHRIRAVSLLPNIEQAVDSNALIGDSARLLATVEILDWVRERKERALVFIESHKVQQLFAEFLRLRYDLLEVGVINGDTPLKRRQAHVERFQRHIERDEGFDVLVLGPKAAGTGLTLTAANHVIHLSRWWNPAVEEQCNDRTHRIGQSKPVTIHIPMAVDPELPTKTFDCLLQNLMAKKRQLAEAVLWPAGDTLEDLKILEDGMTMPDDAENIVSVSGMEEQITALAKYNDLAPVEKISENVLRLKPKQGGGSVLVGFDPKEEEWRALEAQSDDVAMVKLVTTPSTVPVRPEVPATLPSSRLEGALLGLWPTYLLPG